MNESETIEKKVVKPTIKVEKTNEEKGIIDYEELFRKKNKSELEKYEEFLKAVDGLDEETKEEKIKEFKRLMDAQLGEDDEEKNKKEKLINFDYKTHKLVVEKDYKDLAYKLTGKIKSDPNIQANGIFSFLKRINTELSNEFTTDQLKDLTDCIKVIKNKRKTDKKTGTISVKTVSTTKDNKMKMDDGFVELNPNYKPRNTELFEDFM